MSYQLLAYSLRRFILYISLESEEIRLLTCFRPRQETSSSARLFTSLLVRRSVKIESQCCN